MVENGFEELYIITESGQTLFEHSFSNSQKDKDESNQFLLASTLTAILHFIKVSSGQDISNFKFGKHVIYFTRNTDYGILYVLIFPTSKGKMPKDEELRKRLDLIKHNFESKYSKETILGWKGLIGQFDDFRNIVDADVIKSKDIIGAFKKGLW